MTRRGGRPGRLRRGLAFTTELLRSFYQRPLAWLALFVSATFLTYGGGAVMFWLHAVVRGERGPAIDNLQHWLLDSTLGFVALTPVLGVILPVALWHAGGGTSPAERVRLGVYAAVVAAVFTAFTGPGPLLHNAVAGAGTPVAKVAMSVFGERTGPMADGMHGHSPSPLSEGVLQLGAGFPVYLACTWLAFQSTRLTVRATRRRPTGRADGDGALRHPVSLR